MICATNNPAVRRYKRRFLVTMLFYVLFIVVSVWVFVHHRPAGVLAYGLADVVQQWEAATAAASVDFPTPLRPSRETRIGAHPPSSLCRMRSAMRVTAVPREADTAVSLRVR